jgi:hypothetical protein
MVVLDIRPAHDGKPILALLEAQVEVHSGGFLERVQHVISKVHNPIRNL